jgi:hypothetical protein
MGLTRHRMSTDEVGRKLVAPCQAGKNLEALDTLYAKDAQSIEAMSMPELPARMQGLDAIKKKNEWWFANNELHSGVAKGLKEEFFYSMG